MDRNDIRRTTATRPSVALRKESVDRNSRPLFFSCWLLASLSARRAWIEIRDADGAYLVDSSRSPQGERG